MSDTEFDVIIAADLIPDLAEKDSGALVGLVAGTQLKVEGMALDAARAFADGLADQLLAGSKDAHAKGQRA